MGVVGVIAQATNAPVAGPTISLASTATGSGDNSILSTVDVCGITSGSNSTGQGFTANSGEYVITYDISASAMQSSLPGCSPVYVLEFQGYIRNTSTGSQNTSATYAYQLTIDTNSITSGKGTPSIIGSSSSAYNAISAGIGLAFQLAVGGTGGRDEQWPVSGDYVILRLLSTAVESGLTSTSPALLIKLQWVT